MKIRTYFNTIVFFIFFLQILLVSAAHAANKIMPLGDSITDGEAGSTNDTGYRRSLYFSLNDTGYSPDFVGSLNSGIPDDFDKNHEGHGGLTDDQIAADVYVYLTSNPADIVLLHIGTNGLEESAAGVAAILDEIDRYEDDNGVIIWVVLARIINRNCSIESPLCPAESATTTTFNDNVEIMALDRVNNSLNLAYPDKIVMVDMEEGAEIDYLLSPLGDMDDNLHPYDTGYAKMANLWFTGLMEILPQAFADADPTNPKETTMVTLVGTGSTAGNVGAPITTYLWKQTAGTDVGTINNADTATATFTAPNFVSGANTLTFQLTVTDNDGLTSSDTVSIDVIDRINPVADAGPDQDVKEGDSVTPDGAASTDSDGSVVSYLWEQTAGTTVINFTGTSTVTATFTAPDFVSGANILTFRLTVTDDDGLTSSDSTNVKVNDKIRPVADAGADQEVDEGNLVTPDGSNSSDADGMIASYLWEQVPGGTPVQLSGASTATATFIAPDVGSAGEILTFQLTVTDDDDLESTDTVKITVHNPTSSGGGGGGGGGCFIVTAAKSSPMALSGKVLREFHSWFTMENWKRLMPRDINLLTPRAERAATPAIVVTMVVFISSCVATTLGKPRKRWLKL